MDFFQEDVKIMNGKKILALVALIGSPLGLALSAVVLPKLFILLFGITGLLGAGLVFLLIADLLLPIDFPTLLL